VKASRKGAAPANRCTNPPRWPDPAATRRVEIKRIGGQDLFWKQQRQTGSCFGRKEACSRQRLEVLGCRGVARVFHVIPTCGSPAQPMVASQTSTPFGPKTCTNSRFGSNLGREKGAWPWFSTTGMMSTIRHQQSIAVKNSDLSPPPCAHLATVPQTEDEIVDVNAWTTAVTRRQVTDRTCGRPTETRQSRQLSTRHNTKQ
jgi:hypothetical protein